MRSPQSGLSGFVEAGLAVEIAAVLTASQLRPPARPAPAANIRPIVSDAEWSQVTEVHQSVADDEGQDSPSHRAFLQARTAEARGLAEAGHGLFFGAFLEGRLSSFLGLVPDRCGLARFQTVETRPEHRRQGLASWLVYTVGIRGLTELGAHRLVIVADPDGPAINLYRSLGFLEKESQIQMCRFAKPSARPETSATPR